MSVSPSVPGNSAESISAPAVRLHFLMGWIVGLEERAGYSFSIRVGGFVRVGVYVCVLVS